nr:hypothetical protein CFP56_47455 [Quercus suber]
MVNSIIKETDLNPYGEHSLKDLGVSGLYDLSREIENKERKQYIEVVYTLNKKLTTMLAKLKEESCLKEEAKKAKTNLMMELTILYEQIDKAKADTMAKFRVSQPFFDACGVYYGDEFNDCLKQVGAAYPNLDLS